MKRKKRQSSFYGIGQNIGTGYVYYKSLLEANNTAENADMLRDIAIQNISSVPRSNSELENVALQISQTLQDQAMAEAEKELNFLREVFGVYLTWDPTNLQNLEEQLTNAFEQCLQLEDVLQRLIAHYQRGNTKTTDYFIFGDHMKKAWDAHANDFKKLINPQLTSEEQTEVFKQFIQNTIIPDAIKRFSEIKVSSYANDNEEDGSLKELYTMLNQMSAAGKATLIGQLYDQYHLEEIAAIFATSVTKPNVEEIRKAADWKTVDFLRGGSIAEYFTQAMAESIIQGVTNSNKKDIATAKAFGTGGLGLKSDIILAFGVNFDYIEKLMANNESVSRTRNVKIVKELDNKLRNIKNGHIAHISEKDYGKGTYRGHGFQGEKDVSFRNIRSINLRSSDTKHNVINLIGAICQTLKGAILEGERDQLVQLLASQIAIFLFDDIFNLGRDMADLKGVRGNEIHLFYLSGFYIPLSILLNRLSLAFAAAGNEWGSGDISRWAQIEVKMPKEIQFWKQEQQYLAVLNGKSNQTHDDIWEPGMWTQQKSTVLDESTITAHFFKGIDEIFQKIHL